MSLPNLGARSSLYGATVRYGRKGNWTDGSSATSTGKDCPAASASGTLLDTISRGDNVRVRGKIVVEVDSTTR